MRKRSPANSAASLPPVPARISRMALFSSAASLGRRSWRTVSASIAIRSSSCRASSAAIVAHLGIVEERLEPARSFSRGAQLDDGRVDRLELGPLAAELDQRVAVDRLRQPVVDHPPSRATRPSIFASGSMASTAGSRSANTGMPSASAKARQRRPERARLAVAVEQVHRARSRELARHRAPASSP